MAEAPAAKGSKSTGGTSAVRNGTRTPMSDEHKQALAEGREHGKIVNSYLDALEETKPKRGRQVTPETIKERIAQVEREIPTARPSERLHLFQRKIDLEAQLARSGSTVDISDLEKSFVKVAKSYAERRGLTYTAFREVGVPPQVLKDAGITRTLVSV